MTPFLEEVKSVRVAAGDVAYTIRMVWTLLLCC